MAVVLAFLGFVSACLAAPAIRAASPTVIIPSPDATIIGNAGDVESFLGIPFAKSPVGSLRLKTPEALTESLGTITATLYGKACPQFYFSDNAGLDGLIPTAELGLLLNTPLFQTITNAGEDCLNINVQRPAGVNSTSKLPVLFWIFGGGFELGSNSMYDGTTWVSESISEGKPVIYVAVNYRVGGFGFLPGKEILADGSANLGLLDQRLGLQWVADNIEAFGGDPDKVTIWGESAGSISVLDQMLLYDGDNTYNGKALFRGAIMNSGTVVPADPVDCPKGQDVYDAVVDAAGCSLATDTLECLRNVDYETLLNATNSVPGILSYHSVALSYLPRPDGTVLTQSPDLLVEAGTYASVPFIVGDQEDEGTLFALFQSNITTTAELVTYLSTIFFHSATTSQIEELIATYPTISDGSPFRTGTLNNWYAEFKVLAAILGDLTFTLSRRAFLNEASTVKPDVPFWSYISSYDYGTPILGTFHGSDLLQVFYGILSNYASGAFHAYYLSFVNTLDPNNGTSSTYADWPQWSTSKQLINMYPTFSVYIDDDFRDDTYTFLADNIESFYI
ncbi:putative lipase 3 precursor [Phaeomoniella chlamydospora]|uniref:Carboxylic ester hydrolase n=1 Tax=Phaeomoniella chlamydospora TaxID=158046 RepID=A0A0G2E7D6_PHACM|nr:putative lipase 3 precursor [Phaeomoniella chlamydospora]